jgi:acylphosphatase
MVKNYRIQVIGTVQGVWFRKYTREAALRYNLLGLVKNEQNGSVYIEAQGDEKDLELFIQWLYNGSPMSKVEEVKWKEASLQHFIRFDISR